jgi:hypothetical protein
MENVSKLKCSYLYVSVCISVYLGCIYMYSPCIWLCHLRLRFILKFLKEPDEPGTASACRQLGTMRLAASVDTSNTDPYSWDAFKTIHWYIQIHTDTHLMLYVYIETISKDKMLIHTHTTCFICSHQFRYIHTDTYMYASVCIQYVSVCRYVDTDRYTL